MQKTAEGEHTVHKLKLLCTEEYQWSFPRRTVGHSLTRFLSLTHPRLPHQALGQEKVALSDLRHLSYCLHASGSNNCISNLLQLTIITVWILSSNSLIPFPFFNSVRESRRGVRFCCCSEKKLQKEHQSREDRERKNIKNPPKLIKECGFIGVPGQKMRM